MNRRLLERLSEGPHSEFLEHFRSSRYEFFGIELHNTDVDSQPIGHMMLASGHQGRVRFSLPDILSAIETSGANAITMIHNHPFSPTFKPSRLDIEVTERVHLALQEIGAKVIDHRIYVSDGRFFSFVEEKVGRWGWDSVEFERPSKAPDAGPRSA